MSASDETQSTDKHALFRLSAEILVMSFALFLCLPEIAAQTQSQTDPFDVDVSVEFAEIYQAMKKDDYDLAEKRLSKKHALAVRVKNRILLEEVLVVKKEVNRLKLEFDNVRKYYETLKKNPKDPQANEQVGIFYCAVKGDWGIGLQLLSRAKNVTIQRTARTDLKRPVDHSERVKLADVWWKLADGTMGPFRKACQLRGRYWYLLARPNLTLAMRLNFDKRLQQIPLIANKIVIWNQHNGPHFNYGTITCRVALLYSGKSVWRQVVQVPWKSDAPSSRIVHPPDVRFDQIRVDITRFVGLGGGLGELEVFDGTINVAKNCSAFASDFYQNDPRFVPSNINDGDTSGNSGYWILNKGRKGWIAIDMVNRL
ncbi:hypothetical protein [Gimesia aquarii]|uniref:Uncharacterized protein n=1 Tax=Gimesia aquarii TaxID=2527964 RepID=A0A517VNM4_9PLAN|nr:hypothetical protein [Gimesia aquarii]QDT94622.1 hypothetical protein V144x_00520 [Gimesia aquarii]